MKIKEIIVKDFGGIETQIIEPQKITCLLGKNGASKSTILTAIKRLSLERWSQMIFELEHQKRM